MRITYIRFLQYITFKDFYKISQRWRLECLANITNMINFLENRIKLKPVIIGNIQIAWKMRQHLHITHTISMLFSSLPGSDEIRQRKTAHARINGPASFVSNAFKVEIIASISWISAKVIADAPCLRYKYSNF